MKVVSVDERDVRWGRESHRFRVFLFRPGPGPGPGFGADVFDVVEAELSAVISWAKGQASSDRLYAVALVHDAKERGRGLLWLLGMDANSAPATAAQRRAMEAMLRRYEPDIDGP